MYLEQTKSNDFEFANEEWMRADLRDYDDGSPVRGAFYFVLDLTLRGWIVNIYEAETALEFHVFAEGVALGVAGTSFESRDLCKYIGSNRAGFNIALSQWGESKLKLLATRLQHFSPAEASRSAEIIIEVAGETSKLRFSEARFTRLDLLASVNRALGADPLPTEAKFAEPEPANVLSSARAEALEDTAAATSLLNEMQSGPRYRGGIDLLQDGRLRGWAVDLCNPDEPVELALLADGHFVAKGRTSTHRRDIASFLPENVAGFSFDLRACSNEVLLAVIDRIDNWALTRLRDENCLTVELNGCASWIEVGEFAVTNADLKSQVQSILDMREAAAARDPESDRRNSTQRQPGDYNATLPELCESESPRDDTFPPSSHVSDRPPDEMGWFLSRLAEERQKSLILLECLTGDQRRLAEFREQAGDDIGRLLAFVLKDRLCRQSGLAESIKAHASAIVEFFDPFYYSADPSAHPTEIDNPLLHYIIIGWKDERRPHPLFDPQYYKTQLVTDIGDPLLHFVRSGAEAGLNPHPLFDTNFYRAAHLPGDTDSNPLLHYLTTGGRSGLDPSPLFNTAKFLRDAPMANSSSCPLETFVVTRELHELEIVPGFDAKLYRYQLEQELGECLRVPPIADYLARGFRNTTLLPNLLFDPAYYHEFNGISFDDPALLHYLQQGERAKLECHPFFSVTFYNEQRGADCDGVSALEQAWRNPDSGVRANRHASGPIDRRLLGFVQDLIEKGNEFEVAFYRETNPDLRTMTDSELEEHYILHALPENRVTNRAELMRQSGARIADINLGFYADEYVYLNPDLQYLAANFLGAFGHYMRHGRWEGSRLIGEWQLHCNDIEFEAPSANAPLRVFVDQERIDLGIVMHVFYAELWRELAGFANNFSDQRCDLFINLVDEIWTPELYQDIRTACPGAFLLLSNDSGRDVGGLMRMLDTIQLRKYKVFAFMHTKKSPHIASEHGEYWRRTLLRSIAGNKEIANSNMILFDQDPTIGMIASGQWRSDDMGNNHSNYEFLLDMLDVKGECRAIDYISGFMFLVRSEILERLYNCIGHLDWEYGGDKDLEFHMDGQIAHGVERVLPALVRQMGYQIIYR